MKNYQEIFGWFPEETVEALNKIIVDYEINSVIEIGSFVGKSTVYFASKGLNVIAIDPFIAWEDKGKGMNGDVLVHGGEDFYDKFLENTKGYNNISGIRGTSKEMAESNIKDADLIYIDGLHDYDSVKQDIALWDSKAVKIICGDDYDENWEGVKKAVQEFYGDRFKIKGRFWYVVKQYGDRN